MSLTSNVIHQVTAFLIEHHKTFRREPGFLADCLDGYIDELQRTGAITIPAHESATSTQITFTI